METQKVVCRRFNANPIPCKDGDKLGIAIETIGKLPINGLRLSPEDDTCGWYIWCGEEMSKESGFFKPLHVCHLKEYLPTVVQYLSLPPGHRFLIADDYEDVWLEPELVNCC